MIKLKQVSSLEKIRLNDKLRYKEIKKSRVLKGEKFSYQISALSDLDPGQLRVSVDSELKDYIELYFVKNTVMDFPTYEKCKDNDYITKTPGLMPDLLVPANDCNNVFVSTPNLPATVWIRLCVPQNIHQGKYNINVQFESVYGGETAVKNLELEVLDIRIPDHDIITTQWFHVDSIASAHGVKIYSKKHWELIEKYIEMASDIGLNMILTPVITPPLDTAVNHQRANVQLVSIEKIGSEYKFDFSKLHKWVDICKKHGIKYYEISHLFSQWGSKYSPNIYIKENGRLKHYFGWHISATDTKYVDFIKQFVPSLCNELKLMGISANSYFHISDEPSVRNIQTYKMAYDLIKPHIGQSKTMDALSNYEFYEQGLVECPVTASDHIDEFLKHNIANQWVYYCCGEHTGVSNRFLSMPSYRNRVMGIQMFKYNIKGFLQWGYNFYNVQYSYYPLNPYLSSSSDMAFPSGDSFTVYPGKDKPYPSLRGFVFQEGLQDFALCKLLEKRLGHEKVVEIVEDVAGIEIKFNSYPKENSFLLNLRQRIIDELLK